MTEKQKDCILEIQDAILSINSIVKKHGLENEFLSCIALGFLDLDTSYEDEYGEERADMSLLSSFSVSDEAELEDLMSYCLEAYNSEMLEDKKDKSSIDYWINLSRGDDSVN